MCASQPHLLWVIYFYATISELLSNVVADPLKHSLYYSLGSSIHAICSSLIITKYSSPVGCILIVSFAALASWSSIADATTVLPPCFLQLASLLSALLPLFHFISRTLDLSRYHFKYYLLGLKLISLPNHSKRFRCFIQYLMSVTDDRNFISSPAMSRL